MFTVSFFLLVKYIMKNFQAFEDWIIKRTQLVNILAWRSIFLLDTYSAHQKKIIAWPISSKVTWMTYFENYLPSPLSGINVHMLLDIWQMYVEKRLNNKLYWVIWYYGVFFFLKVFCCFPNFFYIFNNFLI